LLINIGKGMQTVLVELEEYDGSISLGDVLREFGEIGYSEKFLRDLKAGFEMSEIFCCD